MLEFENARDSLKFLIKRYKIKKLHIPYYLCDVIRHSVVEVGAKPEFYHIDDNFMPTKDFEQKDFILYPNYFGICSKNVNLLCSKYTYMIIDNAHSYYSSPKGFACFNSAKKFLPVKNGSNLFISPYSKSNLIIIDKTAIERQQKFNEFHQKYKSTNLLNIEIEQCDIPFCYPYLLESEKSADDLVNKLKKDGITIYRYWNPIPGTYNEYKFYSRLVPIPLNN